MPLHGTEVGSKNVARTITFSSHDRGAACNSRARGAATWSHSFRCELFPWTGDGQGDSRALDVYKQHRMVGGEAATAHL